MSASGLPDPERVAELFEAFADLPPAEAEQKLAEACAGDDALREAVAQILRSDRAAPVGFLASPLEAVPQDEPFAGSSRLGRYYVLQKIAEGGMGLVYVGYDDALHRRVALKILRRGVVVREWLLREGQALGRLSHPNVVAVHEVGEHEGRAFLAMEFIEGPTLRTWLEAGPRSFADTLHLFLQAGRGLHAAHRAQQALDHIPLVITGEDQALFLLDAPQIVLFMLHMQVHVAGKDFQQCFFASHRGVSFLCKAV